MFHVRISLCFPQPRHMCRLLVGSCSEPCKNKNASRSFGVHVRIYSSVTKPLHHLEMPCKEPMYWCKCVCVCHDSDHLESAVHSCISARQFQVPAARSCSARTCVAQKKTAWSHSTRPAPCLGQKLQFQDGSRSARTHLGLAQSAICSSAAEGFF